ncbi:protein Iojap-related, mitochondrial isoform X2 [Rhodamnia argentea]|uniref:Protein Iojap-related, mitochondrial isoform X2 n=1 Tax=Rhodamnia argentea TaxID=178133 RepID=A0A8B8Q4F7_9MYRT|nr:protein Iojap-related, mitochondrial isoform X2 [Rhodamnia argentea]
MWSALLRSRLAPSSSLAQYQQWSLGFLGASRACSTSTAAAHGVDQWSILDLQEVEKVLSDVRADDVKVIPGRKDRDWADYIVLATGRSSWHVKNIAQALLYKAKQKQKGARRLMLPSVSWSTSSGGKSSAKKEVKEGKWVVVDSGKVVVHALDEEARAYYDLDGLLSTDSYQEDSIQDLGKALVKIRRKNNSKRRTQNGA